MSTTEGSTASKISKKSNYSHHFLETSSSQCPVVFHPGYDVTFCGLEKCHPFDAGKWGRVFGYLQDFGLMTRESVVQPEAATKEDLLKIHTKRYLRSLSCPCVLAAIVEIPPAAFIPPCLTDCFFLKNMRRQTGGTVTACWLALEHGWAINIGGGFHHASSDSGGGFCVYADISLAATILFEGGLVERIMVVDCDAHQGNGHERDLGPNERVFILDVFNPSIYPRDHVARGYIDREVHVDRRMSDQTYLQLLETALSRSLDQFHPNLVIYNAGTDCLDGDALGGLAVTEQGVIQREELVFSQCRSRGISIAMVTSGGYQKNNALIIANSIRNLHQQHLIQLK